MATIASPPLVRPRARTPVARGVFIGREHDRQMALESLRSGERLLTILGPPGMGKTRLVHEVLARDGATPVTFVDLTQIVGSEALCERIADALGFTLAATGPLPAQVALFLAAAGPMRLFLDNFEHLVEHAEDTVGRWLDVAPELSIVVTSRERLRLTREQVHELGPLELANRDARPTDPLSEAELLFLARAGEVRPGFAPSVHEQSTIASIVRRLDGVPLAIELAAAQMSVLSPTQLLSTLSRRLTDWESDRRDVAPRHRTLHAAIAWSWELIGTEEQSALTQLSVFQGGFDFDAARAVVRVPGERSVFAILGALRDKSFLRVSQNAELPGQVRLAMYEYVREFVVSMTTPERTAAARRRHAAHYLELVEASGSQVETDPEVAARLAVETGNLVVAARHTIACARDEGADDALRIALGIDPLLAARGRAELRRDLLVETLAAATAHGASPLLVAWTLRARGACAFDRRDIDDARTCIASAQAILESKEDRQLDALLLADTGWIELETGRPREAEEVLTRAVVLASQADAPLAEARALYGLGKIREYRGNLRTEARAFYVRAVTSYHQAGSRCSEARARLHVMDAEIQLRVPGWEQHVPAVREVADAFGHLGLQGALDIVTAYARLDAGDLDEAERLATSALVRLRAIVDPYTETLAGGALASIALLRGDLVGAHRAFSQATLSFRRMGNARWEAVYHGYVAASEALLGDSAAARASLAEAIQLNELLADTSVAASLCLQEILVRLCDALRSPDESARRLVLSQARAALAGDDIRETAAQSNSVRFQLRIVDRALSELARTTGDPSSWWIADDGAECGAPGGTVVSLARRKPLRRIVLALGRQYVARRGQALDHDAIIAAGWPGERMDRGAGINRLNAAMTALRKLGLAPLLQTAPGGYRLDPEATVSFRPHAPPAR